MLSFYHFQLSLTKKNLSSIFLDHIVVIVRNVKKYLKIHSSKCGKTFSYVWAFESNISSIFTDMYLEQFFLKYLLLVQNLNILLDLLKQVWLGVLSYIPVMIFSMSLENCIDLFFTIYSTVDVDLGQMEIIKNVTSIKTTDPTCGTRCIISCHAYTGKINNQSLKRNTDTIILLKLWETDKIKCTNLQYSRKPFSKCGRWWNLSHRVWNYNHWSMWRGIKACLDFWNRSFICKRCTPWQYSKSMCYQ